MIDTLLSEIVLGLYASHPHSSIFMRHMCSNTAPRGSYTKTRMLQTRDASVGSLQ